MCGALRRLPGHGGVRACVSPEFGLVYTDASALNSRLLGYESAAFAAIQLRGDHVVAPWTGITGLVPAYLCATAAAAERLALAVGAVFTTTFVYIRATSLLGFSSRRAAVAAARMRTDEVASTRPRRRIEKCIRVIPSVGRPEVRHPPEGGG